MVSLGSVNVLMVTIDEPVMPGLAQSASQHGWHFLHTSRADQVMREVCQYRPHVLIVQLSQSVDESLEVIRLVRSHWYQVRLIAIAQDHHPDIETLARSAGASCYLPDADDSARIDQTVCEVLAGHDAAGELDRRLDSLPLTPAHHPTATLPPMTRSRMRLNDAG